MINAMYFYSFSDNPLNMPKQTRQSAGLFSLSKNPSFR